MRNQYNQGIFYQTALEEQVAALEKTVAADNKTITVQLTEMAQLQHDIIALRKVRAELETEVATFADMLTNRNQKITQLEADLDDRQSQIGMMRDAHKSLQAKLASQQHMTMLAQEEVSANEFRIQDLVAIVSEAEQALSSEKKLSASAYANVKRLSQQVDTLK
ncbi:MAG: hypothetical protein GY779_17545, partial [Gammaproteobacteria bacterium]|nr:hypothetical protein [Gammaproteobacteria bacterium]